MLLAANPPTVPKCLWTNLLENIDLGKVAILDHFVKMGYPRAAIDQMCLCIEARKTAKRKAESG